MKRDEFIKTALTGIIGTAMMDLNSFASAIDDGKKAQRMPALFIGHGSPMNALAQNAFTQSLTKTGNELPLPKAILVVSAHWQTNGTFVADTTKPKTIHDFGGFPRALFEVEYPAPGAPEFAKQTRELIKSVEVKFDHDMGFDHGAWTVLKHMYPKANIPVYQLSLDYTQPAQYHYNLAMQLNALRDKGVLIVGSGNIVHNLGMLNWNDPQAKFDWSVEFDTTVKNKLTAKDHQSLIHYEKLGQAARLSIPTNEHYLPMLYIAALQQKSENISYLYEGIEMGSISMRCFKVA
ncbi:MAG TPA: 4,5-DOPA dioxygenase extradiol [Bacteroidia bacterium]|nr:4,5-DOPA dioxygenase extradiol [Bacteroidia bacterium]